MRPLTMKTPEAELCRHGRKLFRKMFCWIHVDDLLVCEPLNPEPQSPPIERLDV